MTQAGSTHRHPRTGALTGALIGIHAREHSQASTHGNTLRHPCTGALTGTHGSTHRHPRTGAHTDTHAREHSQTPTHGSSHRHPLMDRSTTDTHAREHSQTPPQAHPAPARRPPTAYLAGLELALSGLQASLQGGHAVQHRPAFPLSTPRVLLLLCQLGLCPAQTPVHTAPGCGPHLARQAWPRPEPSEPWGLGVWMWGPPPQGSPGDHHLPPPWEEPKSEARTPG